MTPPPVPKPGSPGEIDLAEVEKREEEWLQAIQATQRRLLAYGRLTLAWMLGHAP